MANDTPADELLRTLGREVMKVYRVYDVSDRLIEQYETLANTVDGGPALKTTYTYDGAATQPQKMKEELSTWSAAYEI